MSAPMRAPGGRVAARQGGRFLAVSVAGLAIDIGAASALALGAGLPLQRAAAAGFACGLAVNYLAHTYWTFRESRRRPSLGHAAQFALVTLGVLGARLAALAALERLAPLSPWPVSAPLLLLAAAGASFAANFVLLRLIVFRAASDGGADASTPRSSLRVRSDRAAASSPSGAATRPKLDQADSG